MKNYLCVFNNKKADDKYCLKDFLGQLDPVTDRLQYVLTNNIEEAVYIAKANNIVYFHLYERDHAEEELVYNYLYSLVTPEGGEKNDN